MTDYTHLLSNFPNKSYTILPMLSFQENKHFNFIAYYLTNFFLRQDKFSIRSQCETINAPKI